MTHKLLNIYLSSTDFHEGNDNIDDVNWKANFIKHFINPLEVNNSIYDVSCHDPLQNISDKAEIVNDDICNIIQSDFIVCYLPKTKLTIGTLMELQYSCLKKPKDCIIVIDRYQIHRNHPWIKYWVKHIVDNESDAVIKMRNILGSGRFINLKERWYYE